MSKSNKFINALGEKLEFLFDGEFKYYKSRNELRRKRFEGHDIVVLSVASKYSPLVSLSFYFGRNYSKLKKVEKLLNVSKPMHIQQYSLNTQKMTGLSSLNESSWQVNIDSCSILELAFEMKESSKSIAYPFFDRFRNLKEAQIALSKSDSWCLSADGFNYRSLLLIDAGLNELNHFTVWSKNLKSEYLENAINDLEKLSSLYD